MNSASVHIGMRVRMVSPIDIDWRKGLKTGDVGIVESIDVIPDVRWDGLVRPDLPNGSSRSSMWPVQSHQIEEEA